MPPAPEPASAGAPDPSAESESFLRNLRLWAGDFSGFLQARLELAGLEGREALGHYIKVALLVALAVFGLTFGYVFLMVGMVMVLTYFTGWPLVWPILIVALSHFVAAALFLLAVKKRLATPQFQQTLAEFKKDRDWSA